MLHAKKKGIVLITTLLTVVLVVMMITAVVHSGASNLSLTAGFHHRENALLAAESGIQYAATRLQDNIFWHGDGFGSTTTFEKNGLKVVEDNGNVIGVIRSTTGTVSAFRIKFNYEDGNDEEKDRNLPEKDGLHDPSEAYKINNRFVSVNNLTNPSSTLIFRANDNGVKAKDKPETYYIPRGTACIIVEGLAGTSLRDITAPHQLMDKSHPEVYAKAVKRVVECYLTFSDNQKIDGVAYAGGNIDVELGNRHHDGRGKFRVYNKNSNECPYIRSLNDINVYPSDEAKNSRHYDNRTVSFYKEQRTNVSPGSSGNFILNGEKKDVSSTCDEDNFHRIEWEEIKKASSTDPVLAGGTYVWVKTSDGTYDLMHSDRVYRIPLKEQESGSDDGSNDDSNINVDPDVPIEKNISQVDIKNNPNEWKTVSSLPNGMHIDRKNMIIYIDNNIQVTDTKGVSIRTTTEVTKRSFVAITPASNSLNSSIITTAGNIDIEGGLIGSGSLTSEGQITCQGSSIMESDPETGVSMYAKGDINLQEITKVPEGNNKSEDPSSWQIDISQYASENVSGDEDEDSGNSPSDDTPDPDEEEGEVIDGAPENGVNYGEQEISEEEQARRQKAWEDKMRKIAETASKLHYADQDLTGIIYTWGNFNCNVGNKNTLSITGSLIAFGADPDNKNAKAGSKQEEDENGNLKNSGNITVKAKRFNLTFDSAAYNGIMGVTGGYTVKRKMWTSWQ